MGLNLKQKRMTNFNIIAGLPRAGSTLLCQILNSNPLFHVTPTSGILDMLKIMRSSFSQNPTFKAQNRLEIYDNFKMGLKGFLNGYFYDSHVVFDKNRAWLSNIKLIDTILENEDTKIIWLYRDPVEIVSSIEAHYQKTYLIENLDEASAPGAFLTLDRRISTYTNPEGLIGFPVECLKDAIEMGYSKRIMVIMYYELTNNPENTLKKIHNFLGLPEYEYDFNNIKQSTWEFDGLYNYKFPHSINEGAIAYKKADIQLEDKYIAAINERFLALNTLILNNDPSLLLGVQMVPVQNESPAETSKENATGLFNKIIQEEQEF